MLTVCIVNCVYCTVFLCCKLYYILYIGTVNVVQIILSPALCVLYYVYSVYHVSCVFCTVLYELCIHQYRMLCEQVIYCGYKSCIVFALLPAQSAMCISSVLYLHYCQRSVC